MALSDFDRDGDGFLTKLDDWTPEFARLAAADEGLAYSDELDEIIRWARNHYEQTGMAPRIRDFARGFYGPKTGDTAQRKAAKYLADLTNGSGMKRIDKIAGLPKPTGCV